MGIKQDIPKHIQKIVANIDAQIEAHKTAIAQLEYNKMIFLTHKPHEVKMAQKNSPLTRDLIRNFLKGYTQPVQTVTIIELLYAGKSADEVDKLVKTLSVILNQMANKTKEVEVIRKKGIKGNFYKWIN